MITAELLELRRATLAARARLKDASIGTRAHAGTLQIVRVVYRCDGTAKIRPITQPMTCREACDFLDAM